MEYTDGLLTVFTKKENRITSADTLIYSPDGQLLRKECTSAVRPPESINYSYKQGRLTVTRELFTVVMGEQNRCTSKTYYLENGVVSRIYRRIYSEE